MSMIYVDGVELPEPSEFTWGIQDVSNSQAGRTEDALMHKNKVADKRKLNLAWQGLTPDKTALVLQACHPEYVSVRYHDAMDNQYETRTFYTGDKTAAVKWWYGATGRYYSKISFNFVER